MLGCDDPNHRPRPRPWRNANQKPRRSQYDWQERQRRRETVEAWQRAYGNYCPYCGRSGAKLTANHIVPVALGGREDGPLDVMCVTCMRKQASAVAAQRRRLRGEGL